MGRGALIERVVFATTLGSFVVLAVSGVMLAQQYEAGAWAVYPGRSATQTVHQGAATVFVIGAVGLVGIAMLRRRTRQAGIAAATVAVAVVGFVTGPMIAWDLIGVRAVLVGSWRGVLKPAFSSDVRFVLIDESEISQGTYRFWVLVHLVALPIALLMAAAGRSRLRAESADLCEVAVEEVDDGARLRR